MTKNLKALFLLALPLFFMLPMTAETLQASKQGSTQSFVRTIPKSLNIEDYIYVKNESSYNLSQVTIHLINSKGQYIRLGATGRLKKDDKKVIKSYSNDRLKNLRGMRLSINITTAKKCPRFKVKLDDHRHDLYIEIE